MVAAMTDSSKMMAKTIYNAMDSKQALNIEIIDISEVSTVSDYFIICSGNNGPQLEAIIDNIEFEMNKAGFKGGRPEGQKTGGWFLIDYGEAIAHVFSVEDRSFYNLERIWKDAKNVNISEL